MVVTSAILPARTALIIAILPASTALIIAILPASTALIIAILPAITCLICVRVTPDTEVPMRVFYIVHGP